MSTSAALRAPDAAEVVDLDGATMLPGFIDTHPQLVHFGVVAEPLIDLRMRRIRCLPVCVSGPNRMSAVVLAKRSAVMSGPSLCCIVVLVRIVGSATGGESSRTTGFGGMSYPRIGCPASAVSGKGVVVAVGERVDTLALLLKLVDALIAARPETLQ